MKNKPMITQKYSNPGGVTDPSEIVFNPFRIENTPLVTCRQCKYVWIPRKSAAQIKVCPRCKSYKWNVPQAAPLRKETNGKRKNSNTAARRH